MAKGSKSQCVKNRVRLIHLSFQADMRHVLLTSSSVIFEALILIWQGNSESTLSACRRWMLGSCLSSLCNRPLYTIFWRLVRCSEGMSSATYMAPFTPSSHVGSRPEGRPVMFRKLQVFCAGSQEHLPSVTSYQGAHRI